MLRGIQVRPAQGVPDTCGKHGVCAASPAPNGAAATQLRASPDDARRQNPNPKSEEPPANLPTAAPLDTHTDTHICTPGELPLLKEGRARSGPSAYRLPDRPHDVQAGPRQTGCQAKCQVQPKLIKKVRVCSKLGSWPADSRNTPPGSPRGQAHGIGRVSHWDGDAENSPR